MIDVRSNEKRLGTLACKAKLTAKKNADGSYTYKPNSVQHTHMIDARDKEVKNRLTKAMKSAKETNKTTRDLYAEALCGAPEEIVAQMPKANTFGKMVRNERKGDHPKAPKSLAELVLPEISTTTGENFVMYDSGQDAKDRTIMFSTKQAMDFLTTCETIHMDGTVSSGPVLFDQVYTIHGKPLIIHFRIIILFSPHICIQKHNQMT